MATHNGESYLRQQVTTVLGQVGVEVVVFCSDDNSQDGTKEILGEFSRNFSNFKILLPHQKFGGASLNFYNLIKYLPVENFDYIAFADQDDIWFPNKIIDAIDEMVLFNAYGFSSDVFAYWNYESVRIKRIRKSYPQTNYDYFFESPGPGCTQVMDAELFLDFQKFVTENYTEVSKLDYHDWITYAFSRSNGYKWIISKKINMLYRQHQNNQLGANVGTSATMKRFERLKTGWYAGQVKLLFDMFSHSNEIVSLRFFLKNALKLRRKKSHSILIIALKLFNRM